MATSPQRLRKMLVTGADGVLGGFVAERFLAAGCEVYATFFKQSRELSAGGGKLHWVQADLSEPDAVKKAVGGLELDGLVHCAGGFRWAKIEELSDADFDFLLDSNLRSSFYLAREIVPGMKARGFGRIVFISARATQAPSAGMGAYAASKAGINMLTAALADEVRAQDINVNAVMPTIIDTPANRRDMPKADFSTWVTPQALAEVIYELTQSMGKPIHGALIPVGGRL